MADHLDPDFFQRCLVDDFISRLKGYPLRAPEWLAGVRANPAFALPWVKTVCCHLVLWKTVLMRSTTTFSSPLLIWKYRIGQVDKDGCYFKKTINGFLILSRTSILNKCGPQCLTTEIVLRGLHPKIKREYKDNESLQAMSDHIRSLKEVFIISAWQSLPHNR